MTGLRAWCAGGVAELRSSSSTPVSVADYADASSRSARLQPLICTNTSTFNAVLQNRHFDVSGGGVVVVPPGPPIVGPIPEPATSALLAAGLGWFGYLSRRRGAQRRSG